MNKEIITEIKELYSSIDHCIDLLINARASHDDVAIANAQHKMESLMVETQQVLSRINDSLIEPVSDDLEEAADAYNEEYSKYLYGLSTAFIAGAHWQKEQFEKNRLAACERQTREEAEREQDFVMSIIENEHRQPTYSDAIEYGMRVQKEQMMKDAVDGEITLDYWNSEDREVDVILADNGIGEEHGIKDGDKVKLIIIKED